MSDYCFSPRCNCDGKNPAPRLTAAQVHKITHLGGNPDEFFPDFSLPAGWVMGIAKGVTYGIDPNGQASS